MTYHAYKPGYSVLPQLKKIEAKDIFQISNNLNRYLEEKKVSIKNQLMMTLEYGRGYFYEMRKTFSL